MEIWFLLYNGVMMALLAVGLLIGVRMGYAMGRGAEPEWLLGQMRGSEEAQEGPEADTSYQDPWEEGMEQGLPTRGIETVGGKR